MTQFCEAVVDFIKQIVQLIITYWFVVGTHQYAKKQIQISRHKTVYYIILYFLTQNTVPRYYNIM